MNWLTLSILSVLFHSCFFLLTKKLLNKKTDPYLYGGLMQFTVGLMGLPLIFFSGFYFEVTLINVLLLLLMGITYAIAASLYYSGLQQIDLSKSVIYESTGIFWGVVLGSIFLHEPLTLNKCIGAVLIFAGIYIISRAKDITLKLSRAEIFVLIASFAYAVGALLDKQLVEKSNPFTYLSLAFLVAGTITLLVHIKRLKNQASEIITDISLLKAIAINAFFVLLAYVCIYHAYEIGGEISRIYPVTNSQVIVLSLLGIVLLGEKKDIKRKIFAAFVAFIGLIFIGN